MTDHDNQRNSEEIEKDIHQSRERLDSTLHELEERFSPQQLLNSSYEYIRHGGANEFVANLGNTIKQNPVPFLLTSAGIGWMILAQRNPNAGHSQHYSSAIDEEFYTGERHSSHSHSSNSSNGSYSSNGSPGIPVHEGTHPNDGAPTGYSTGSSGVAEGSSSHSGGKGRMSQVKDSASSMKEGAGNMKEGAKGRAQSLGNKAKHTAQQWKDKANHMGGHMRDTTSHLNHGVHDNAHAMGDRARQTGSQASDFVQEHPLVVGALGFALGAALGGMFPATKKEDEVMGEYRDRAMHKASEAGHEQADRAQQAVHEQADKAQQTVHEKAEEAKEKSHQGQGSNVNSSQDKRQDSGSTTPTSDSSDADRHSTGLAGSSTPSGNTQGSGTNKTP
ncbi:DUF3618 domain-containing protein [Vreelandella sulfidaeris]|uniref:DUF3618 domain-containing protein n=1 Tax=Vreelandella sulfidaeris TaxID=115553 RepID=UPI0035EAC0D0